MKRSFRLHGLFWAGWDVLRGTASGVGFQLCVRAWVVGGCRLDIMALLLCLLLSFLCMVDRYDEWDACTLWW